MVIGTKQEWYYAFDSLNPRADGGTTAGRQLVPRCLMLMAGTGNATFAGKTCFDGTLYSDLYAAGSTIQLGNQFFVSEVAANRADMLLGMTLNAASDFESTGTIKPSGIVLQDGSIILAVDGTTRTVGSAAAATARLTITDTTATFAGSIDVGNDANVTGSATTGYIKLNGNAYNGWMSMDASSLHIGHNSACS
jgi:phage tail sheath gpL-like